MSDQEPATSEKLRPAGQKSKPMLAILFPGIQHLQNIHPLLVHFPIAFLVGAMLLYALAGIFPRLNLGDTAFSLLILGTLSAAAAVGSGLYAEDGVRVSRSVREHLLEVHEKFMIAASALSVVLSAWAVAARPFPGGAGRYFSSCFWAS